MGKHRGADAGLRGTGAASDTTKKVSARAHFEKSESYRQSAIMHGRRAVDAAAQGDTRAQRAHTDSSVNASSASRLESAKGDSAFTTGSPAAARYYDAGIRKNDRQYVDDASNDAVRVERGRTIRKNMKPNG